MIRVGFKPTSTIASSQKTVTREGVETDLKARGRCVEAGLSSRGKGRRKVGGRRAAQRIASSQKTVICKGVGIDLHVYGGAHQHTRPWNVGRSNFYP